MVRRRKRLKRWLSRESAPEEVQPQASAEAPPGVEAESAHPVLDEVRTEPPAEAPEAGVEAPLVAEGEPQLAAHEPEGVEVHVSAGAAEGVEVQLPPEAPEEIPPQPSPEAPEEPIVQFVAQAPPEIEAQAAQASPEIETLLTRSKRPSSETRSRRRGDSTPGSSWGERPRAGSRPSMMQWS